MRRRNIFVALTTEWHGGLGLGGEGNLMSRSPATIRAREPCRGMAWHQW